MLTINEDCSGISRRFLVIYLLSKHMHRQGRKGRRTKRKNFLLISSGISLETCKATKSKPFLIANHLNRAVANFGRKPLKVFVQVNTSGEESKYGVEPSGCVDLAKHVKFVCPNLIFSGLMTIGMLDYSSTPENFNTLRKCRNEVCEALGIPEEQCDLSMGMSADFEQAIEMGSTNVRIGSTIFGAREYPKKDKDSEPKS